MESQPAEPGQHVAAFDEASETEEREPDSVPDTMMAANESSTATKNKYPSAFKRNVIVGSLMLAIFLVGSTSPPLSCVAIH